MKKMTTCLWFDTQAEEAAKFYTSVFPDSALGNVARYGKAGAQVSGREEGSVMMVEFTLMGMDFMGLNGGPLFSFSEAVSIVVPCETQQEVDQYWEKLLAGGGKESQCGWLKDKYGFSWQITPNRLMELQRNPDPAVRERVMQAMITMQKLDIAKLEEAAAKG